MIVSFSSVKLRSGTAACIAVRGVVLQCDACFLDSCLSMLLREGASWCVLHLRRPVWCWHPL